MPGELGQRLIGCGRCIRTTVALPRAIRDDAVGRNCGDPHGSRPRRQPEARRQTRADDQDNGRAGRNAPMTAAPMHELGFYTLAGAPRSPRDLIDEVRQGEALAVGGLAEAKLRS